MSALGNVVLVAAVMSAAAAFAAPTQLTDAQYIAAAHCQGLYDSHALGAVDASGIDSLMKSEGKSRSPEIADRADEARNQARSAANRAGPLMKSQLASERNGACQVWASSGGPGMTSASR